jgi:hypothetical protein
MIESRINSRFGWGLSRRIEAFSFSKAKHHVQKVCTVASLDQNFSDGLTSPERAFLLSWISSASRDCSLWQWELHLLCRKLQHTHMRIPLTMRERKVPSYQLADGRN